MSTGPQFPNGSANLWNPKLDNLLKTGAVAPSKLQRAIQQIQRDNPHVDLKRILKRTAELNLLNWKIPWSDADKAYLLDCAREFSVADIAKRLRRTPGAVYVLLSRSKTTGRRADGYTQTELARDLHVSKRKVRRWIQLGWLIPYQGRIKDRSLQRFLGEHGDEIDASKLECDLKFWLESLGLRNSGNTRSSVRFRERKQSYKLHTCTHCGRRIYGNAIWQHLKACVQAKRSKPSSSNRAQHESRVATSRLHLDSDSTDSLKENRASEKFFATQNLANCPIKAVSTKPLVSQLITDTARFSNGAPNREGSQNISHVIGRSLMKVSGSHLRFDAWEADSSSHPQSN